MINLKFELKNPWGKDRFKNLGSIHGQLTKNKFWELQHTFYDGMLADVDFQFGTKGDHAGLYVVLGLLGYGVHLSVYDNRHWNYETNTWEVYNESR